MIKIIKTVFDEFEKKKYELANDDHYETKIKLLWMARSIFHLFNEKICEDRASCIIFGKIMVFSKVNMKYVNSPDL